MLRSLLILSVLIASSYTVSGQTYTVEPGYYDDFAGKSFCATRYQRGSCCSNRQDDCSVPIAGTLCYCDQFCDQHINPDCCPDYAPFCRGAPDVLRKPCYKDGHMIIPGQEALVNCNLCKCSYASNSSESVLSCENDACLSDIDAIADIDRASSTLGWKAENYTEFYGRKLKDGLTYRLGTFEPRVKVKSMSRLGHHKEELPKSFNSLVTWGTSLSKVPDQGWCGSSWAVSTASVASDRIGINANKFIDISAQNLLSCVRHQQGCTGGHLDNAWRYLNRIGVADEDCYPYVASVERCRAKKSDNLRTLQCSTLIDEKDTLYKMGPAYSLNNETDIMWEIYHYGPVQATMWVHPDFFTYRAGIYRKSSYGDQTAKGFHSVRLIGWGEERFGSHTAKYWIAANSWGTWWGEKGYFRILRGTNECQIEDYVISAMADHDRKINARPARRAHRRTNRKSN